MQIDKSEFPLVFLWDAGGPEVSAEAEFETLLADGRTFVLISKQHRHDPDAHASQEERKSRAWFLKRNKARLQAACAAAIVIEGAGATPMPLKLAAQGFGKAFGVPFHFVRDEDEATALAKDVLARRGA